MKQLKLIAFDLDGTVFPHPLQQSVRPRVQAAFEEAKARGVVIAANTGRPMWMLGRQLLTAPWLDWTISACGSQLASIHEEQEKLFCIDHTSAWRLIQLLEEAQGENFIHSSKFGLIDSNSTKRFLRKRDKMQAEAKFEPQSAQDSFLSLMGTSFIRRCDQMASALAPGAEYAGMQDILKVDSSLASAEVRAKVVEKINAELDLEIALVGERELEITAAQVNKNSGLENLCDLLGIDPEDAVAFGDSGNDFSLCQKRCHFVAMGNSEQKILDAADEVCATVDEDGIAQWLEAAFEQGLC